MMNSIRTALVFVLAAALPVAAGELVFHKGMEGMPFSESVQAGQVLFLSGQIGTGDDGKLVAGGIAPEAHQVMKNIRAALGRRELGMGDVAKCTVFLADITEWPAFNEVYVQYFEGSYPARSALAASGLALDARVEVECIAMLAGE